MQLSGQKVSKRGTKHNLQRVWVCFGAWVGTALISSRTWGEVRCWKCPPGHLPSQAPWCTAGGEEEEEGMRVVEGEEEGEKDEEVEDEREEVVKDVREEEEKTSTSQANQLLLRLSTCQPRTSLRCKSYLSWSYFSIVFLLYFYCISTVFLLYFYCISIVFLVFFYCISNVFGCPPLTSHRCKSYLWCKVFFTIKLWFKMYTDSKYIRLRFCHTSADVVVQGIIYNQSISNLNTGTVHLKFTLCSHNSWPTFNKSRWKLISQIWIKCYKLPREKSAIPTFFTSIIHLLWFSSLLD